MSTTRMQRAVAAVARPAAWPASPHALLRLPEGTAAAAAASGRANLCAHGSRAPMLQPRIRPAHPVLTAGRLHAHARCSAANACLRRTGSPARAPAAACPHSCARFVTAHMRAVTDEGEGLSGHLLWTAGEAAASPHACATATVRARWPLPACGTQQQCTSRARVSQWLTCHALDALPSQVVPPLVAALQPLRAASARAREFNRVP